MASKQRKIKLKHVNKRKVQKNESKTKKRRVKKCHKITTFISLYFELSFVKCRTTNAFAMRSLFTQVMNDE